MAKRRRAAEAMQEAAASARAFLDGNIAKGGVCDFCALPTPLDQALVYSTDREVGATLIGGWEDDLAATDFNYGEHWAACSACAALIDHVREHHVEDPGAVLAAHVVARRAGPGPGNEWRADADAAIEDGLRKLYDELFASGLHRNLNPPAPKTRRSPEFRVEHEPGGPWSAAYDQQLDLYRWTRSPTGKRLNASWVQLETRDQPHKALVYEHLIAGEEAKLLHAPPVYVSEEMCELIDVAREGFEPEKLLAEDLLLPEAFVYFAKPLYLKDRHGSDVSVGAFAYCPIQAAGEHAAGHHFDGIGVSFYSTLRADGAIDRGVPQIREARRAQGIAAYPDLVLLHLAPAWFGLDPSAEALDADLTDPETGEPLVTGATSWWVFLQVTLRLMQQQVSVPTMREPNRHMRRRSQREGIPPKRVVVVRLRRARQRRPDEEEHDVEWTHRWLVTGHWRRQWYPTLGEHRQIRIQGYVKGPEDKPLVVKRKVYEWDR